MSAFSREGFSHLKFAYAVLVAGIIVCGLLIGGTYIYWQAQKKNDAESQRSLNEMRARLETAKRERDDLRDSAETHRILSARGMFVPEQRLDLIEGMAALKTRHRLLSLFYEVGDQRPVKLAGGTVVTGVQVLGSRLRVKVEALHDGDLIGFLDEFPRFKRGLFPMDRCTIKRMSQSQAAASGATGSVGSGGGTPAGAGNPPQVGNVAPPTAQDGERSTSTISFGGVEAECTLEWLTLYDPRGANGAAPAPATPPRPR